jgi:hypothetical protein
MAFDRTVDLDSILMEDVAVESQATLIDHRFTMPTPVELAISKYADSLERLLVAGDSASDDTYTRGFVAGLRAAAKVAATVAGT